MFGLFKSKSSDEQQAKEFVRHMFALGRETCRLVGKAIQVTTSSGVLLPVTDDTSLEVSLAILGTSLATLKGYSTIMSRDRGTEIETWCKQSIKMDYDLPLDSASRLIEAIDEYQAAFERAMQSKINPFGEISGIMLVRLLGPQIKSLSVCVSGTTMLNLDVQGVVGDTMAMMVTQAVAFWKDRMENKITDINDLVDFLAATGMKPLLNDEIWQCYGYKRRPRKGNIWYKLFPKMFELENFISREILTMGLIDVVNGIKKSTVTSDTKLLISIGVIDQFLSTQKGLDPKHFFSSDSFMENLFSTYASYLKSDKSKLHEPVIFKAMDVLNKKDCAKFMVGTIKLLALEHAYDFLLKSDYIKDVIDSSSIENKLKISMSDEMYEKYVPLLSEKILNT